MKQSLQGLRPPRITRRLALVLPWVVLPWVGLLSACGQDEEVLALNYATFEVHDGQDAESAGTSGCQELEDGLGFGFGTFDPSGASYEVDYQLASDSVTYTVKGNAVELASGTYGVDFFRQQQDDEVVVSITDELSLRLVHSGTNTGCEPVADDFPPEFESPGQPDTGEPAVDDGE